MTNPTPDEPTDPQRAEARLEDLLADAELTVAHLQFELQEARRARAGKEDQAAQHEEVDRLQFHLAQAQVHWSEVREFFANVLGDRADEADAGVADDPTTDHPSEPANEATGKQAGAGEPEKGHGGS